MIYHFIMCSLVEQKYLRPLWVSDRWWVAISSEFLIVRAGRAGTRTRNIDFLWFKRVVVLDRSKTWTVCTCNSPFRAFFVTGVPKYYTQETHDDLDGYTCHCITAF